MGNSVANGLSKCEDCSPGTIQWRANQSQCVQCPPEGVNCDFNSQVHVLNGFFRPASNESWNHESFGLDPLTHTAWSVEVLATPVRCPMPGACEGGTIPGEASCAVGHEGPLCGVCTRPQYFHGAFRCQLCPQWSQRAGANVVAAARSVGTVLIMVIVMLLVAVAVFRAFSAVPFYEQGQAVQSASGATSVGERDGGLCAWLCHTASLVWLEAYRARVTIATLIKIMIGYIQVTAAFESFQQVQWPPLFASLLRALQAPLEILADFEMMPLDCLVGRRFNHYERLLGVLLLPFIASLLLLIVAVAVWLTKQRPCDRSSLRMLLMSPTCCSLHIWMLLVFYPMLCREVRRMTSFCLSMPTHDI